MTRGPGRRRMVAWVLAVMLAATSGATCLAAAQQTPEQRACCDAMAHHCDDMSLTSSCCVAPADQDYAVTAALLVPGALSPVALDVPALFSAVHAVGAAPGASPVRSPAVATYLFVSSFRI